MKDKKSYEKDAHFWNKVAGIYDRFMKKDEKLYTEIITLIKKELRTGDVVLEIAAGTGNIALGCCDSVKHFEACDISTQMIAITQQKVKETQIKNLCCSVQNAYEMSFEEHSFDKVIICNALHIMSDPEKALMSILRVLKSDGLLIAPTFTQNTSLRGKILSWLISHLSGFKTYRKWTEESYQAFLMENQFTIEKKVCMEGIFPLCYVTARPINREFPMPINSKQPI